MRTFSEWLHQSELGAYLLKRESAWYDRAVADVFGYRAVQVGLPALDFLRENRIPWQCRAADEGGGHIVCDPTQLPFDSASLDLLLLPHVLDFSSDPHGVLREAERVLVPEGRLMLTGFNPMSLWGVRRMIQGRADAPWSGNFLTLARVKDWFRLMELEPEGGAFMAYAPPFSRADWLRQFDFMEAAGDRWWPLAAGVYAIDAVKRRRGMRLITPRWRAASATKKLLAAGGNDRHPVSRNNDGQT
ncbi:class I SAM-dependent methyltransferase [Paludibacterium paludis]|uniref:Methyltransferase type 11 domain-containing protein n=1 Tax=Paludibacterium paludis TaxID=1225769 RepID=A0A918NXW3_9NEIS|nr:methyltransferase domain-containing protein [Paludibacterium paludis]GGY04171.1 hypothetical protein GCM10011289_03220 [Paludibacterium paludis]